MPGDTATRLVVDVIAGTSAGGINGLFLGKALVNNEPFAPLRDLWVREGDIGGLLNDARSYADPDMKGLDKSRASEPVSLLNSDRMYRKLHVAMSTMSGAAPQGGGPSSCVDELDLFDIIWNHSIWTIQRSGEGFRPMEDRGSPTANHEDHVHIMVT